MVWHPVVFLTEIENEPRSLVFTEGGLCCTPNIFIPSVFSDLLHFVSAEVPNHNYISIAIITDPRIYTHNACSTLFGLVRKSTVVVVASLGNPVMVCTSHLKDLGLSTAAKHRVNIPKIEMVVTNNGMLDSHFSNINYRINPAMKRLVAMTHPGQFPTTASPNPCDCRPKPDKAYDRRASLFSIMAHLLAPFFPPPQNLHANICTD